MKILAIDTALGAVSACVYSSAEHKTLARETFALSRGHAEALFPLIDQVMARLDGGAGALDRIAVTVGPGSFTGIRVGVAAARAFALACNVPAVGVSTLSALAAPLISATEAGVVAACIDARHGQIYVVALTAAGKVILSPRIMPVRDAARMLGSGPIRLAGSGAPLLAIEARTLGLSADVAGELVAPDIAYVARLGALADPAEAPARPLYLKAPDAKPQNAGRIARDTDAALAGS